MQLCLPASGRVHDRGPVPFAETVVLWSVRRAELLNDYRGLAAVAVVIGDELDADICMQVLEAKPERYDKVLHEFDQSRQRLVLR